MATYAELFGLRMNDAIRQRVGVACVVSADMVRMEPAKTDNHAQRLAWATLVLQEPGPTAQVMLHAVLAQNNVLDLSEFTAADDAQLQVWVDAAIDLAAMMLPPVPVDATPQVNPLPEATP